MQAKKRKVMTVAQPPKQVTPSRPLDILPVEGVVAIPRPALLRLALLLHDIKRSVEVRHAQAA